jgi:hypothetical protein
MILADLIHQETGAPLTEIMLLRHSNAETTKARSHNVSIEEYTALQPIDSKYDFYRSGTKKIAIVVVIVDDRVYAVYRVAGVEAEGGVYSLGSPAYQRFELARNKDDRICRRFSLIALPSVSIGLPVRGWDASRSRTPVQRVDGSFFREIEVGPSDDNAFREACERSFQSQVETSLTDSSASRMRRIQYANAIPARIATTSLVFARNPDVVAETLVRAKGICQDCQSPAPFHRRSDGTAYLEVHHRKPLAEGGSDTLDNTIALCPNCHRKAHYG